MRRLGIVAGGGALPRRLKTVAEAGGWDVFILGLKGQTDTETRPDAWCRMGAAGQAISLLRERGVEHIVLAGHVRRPALPELRPDWRTAQLFLRLGRRALGDDTLLRAVASELAREGFTVLAAHDIDPALLSPEGLLGGPAPSVGAMDDVARGIEVARTLGRLDVGQAVVVQQGIVLGVEAVEGTDALLSRCRRLARKGERGVLVKACKPGQDRRLDLPTIGLRTLVGAYQAGLCGIAVEAGASIMLDQDELKHTADRLGLFVIGFS